jgi:hypothetical protein
MAGLTKRTEKKTQTHPKKKLNKSPPLEIFSAFLGFGVFG